MGVGLSDYLLHTNAILSGFHLLCWAPNSKSLLKMALGSSFSLWYQDHYKFSPRVCHRSSVRKYIFWNNFKIQLVNTTSYCQFNSVQSLSRVWFFATLLIAACQASLSITNSRSSLRLTSIESVTPSSHLILCHPLLLLPPIPPSIRVFTSESTLRMRWPK